MKKINSFYDNRIVYKPWGYEYVVYRNLNHLCVTLLSIDYNKTTSLHCHPKKKSGFILVSGKALFQLGLWKKRSEVHSSPSKRMIARGLFHSIKSISNNGRSPQIRTNASISNFLQQLIDLSIKFSKLPQKNLTEFFFAQHRQLYSWKTLSYYSCGEVNNPFMLCHILMA